MKCALTATAVVIAARQPLTVHFFLKSCLKLMHVHTRLSLLP